jgi:hypothetical protein
MIAMRVMAEIVMRTVVGRITGGGGESLPETGLKLSEHVDWVQLLTGAQGTI